MSASLNQTEPIVAVTMDAGDDYYDSSNGSIERLILVLYL
jgi:hypothetical protein